MLTSHRKPGPHWLFPDRNGAVAIHLCIDGFPIRGDDPALQLHETIDLQATTAPDLEPSYPADAPLAYAGKRFEPLARACVGVVTREACAHCFISIVRRMVWSVQARIEERDEPSACSRLGLYGLLCAVFLVLARRKQGMSHNQMLDVLGLVDTCVHRLGCVLPLAKIARAVIRDMPADGPDPDVLEALIRVGESANRRSRHVIPKEYCHVLGMFMYGEERECREVIERAVQIARREILPGNDAWGTAVNAELRAKPVESAHEWLSAVNHAREATGARATRKWLHKAEEHVAQIGSAEFQRMLETLLRLFIETYSDLERSPLDPISDALRGLIWYSVLVPDTSIQDRLCEIALLAYKTIRGEGALCAKAGNAVIYAFGQMEGVRAVSCLAHLERRVKNRSAQRQIRQAKLAAAERAGVTVAELEEMAIPTFDLDAQGRRRIVLGESVASLAIVDGRDVNLLWETADGKPRKSVPAAVKRDHPDVLKALRAEAREIKNVLAAQRDRLDNLFLAERVWPHATWRERYLEHPVVGHCARRLIWRLTEGERDGLGIWHEGTLRDVDDRPLDWLTPETEVRLWHPIGFGEQTVQAWREWLDTHKVTQPFKQAHREVYCMTDVEGRTRSHSRRFEGHVLRQHQLNSLCKVRGWRYQLIGAWDSDSDPVIHLPQYGLSAELQVRLTEGAGAIAASGILMYVTTGRLRFVGSDGEPAPLDTVPPLVFSEIMRDLDLFVGVCTITNDQSWPDRGEQDSTFASYWRQAAFGELATSAEVRREVLARIIPRLKIADRCALGERFLVVRGDLRTYRIHLGRGNVLMSPNDQFLRIAQSLAGTTTTLFLPFEGDDVLSGIIGKALMLAHDTEIGDKSIVDQITHR